MKLIEFGFKNIFSYGNKLQKFEIKQNEPNLVLVHGKRGGGKSSIKEAIILSAYGKSPNRSLKNIPNRLNKNAYLFTKFISNDGSVVEIERGILPNFLELKINGEVPPKLPHKTKVDEYIENTLIQIPFNVFCNTITISVNEFKSFVSLTPADKRKIVDKIFGVGEINDMNALNKLELQKLNQRSTALDLSIEGDERMLISSMEQLDLLKNDVKEFNQAQKDQLQAKLIELEKSKAEAKEKFDEFTPRIAEATNEYNTINEKLSKYRFNSSEFQKKLDVYDKNKCPHCLSDLTGESHNSIKEKLVNKKSEFDKAIPKLIEELSQYRENINQLSNSQSSFRTLYGSLSHEINTVNFSINNSFKDDDNSVESSRLAALITKIEDKIELTKIERDSLKDLLNLHNELATVLSEDGMKKLFMAKIIPMINQKIVERCNEIDFPYSFEFDANFDPIIIHLGQTIELESLSTGEQKEMNLITLFCILDLIIMKLNLNFIFLDEVFTSLDSESIYKVVSMLRSFTDKHKITVFAISHDPLPAEFFDSKISISKDRHFSDMIIE